ncbi:MAG TPA: RES family NAD+ phosphorylase [Ignavibacteria bacterium]|nr:RES family NAD+ phosphorylase [Ignavibacteria bacterium]
MTLFRVSRCKYINDLSGDGAKKYGGRWNKKGIPAIYFSSSISLATLELLVNLSDIKFISDLCSLKIEIPDSLLLEKINHLKLPKNWNEFPFDDSTVNLVSKFLSQNKSLGIIIPSAILPLNIFKYEFNVVLNPLNKDFNKIKVSKSEIYPIDKRLY